MNQIKGQNLVSKKQSKQTQKAITTISTDRETLQKIKLIACLEGRLVKELMNASLKEYIRAYEATHGVIKLGLQQAKG